MTLPKLSRVMKAYRCSAWFVFLIIASVIINVYFRLKPLFLIPLNQWANRDVYTDLMDKASKDVSSFYPELPVSAKDSLIKYRFKEILRQDKTQIKEVIKNKSEEYRQFFQDERGWTYMSSNDAYRALRRVENLLNTGHVGTGFMGKEEYDSFVVGPKEVKIIRDKLHYYLGAYFYKICRFFSRNMSLTESLSLFPIFLSTFLVMATFIICLLLGLSYLPTFIASLGLGLAPTVLFRTSFGGFETDIYNILLPLMIVISLAHAFKNINRMGKVLSIFLAAFLLGIYSSLWGGWWYIFCIIVVSYISYIFNILLIIKKGLFKDKCLKKDIKELSISLLAFIFLTFLSILFISGKGAIDNIYLGLKMLSSFREFSIDKFWPNAGFTVSELRLPGIPRFVYFMGGNVIFFGGILGLLSLFAVAVDNAKDFRERQFLKFVLFIWTVSMLIIVFKRGERFMLMLCVPIGISFGIFVNRLIAFFNRIDKTLKFFKRWDIKLRHLFISGALVVFTISPLKNATIATKNYVYFMDDCWWNTFIKVRENTPPDAIINIDWSWGDWFIYVSKRAVLQEAYYQYTSIPYWFSRALLSLDENEAVGILRMLDSGSYQGFDELSKHIQDKLNCLEVINRLILLKDNEGRILLNRYGVNKKEDVEKIIKLIYRPPPAYITVDSLSIRTIGTILFLGNWDFQKLDIWYKFREIPKNNFKDYLMNRYKHTKEEADRLYSQFMVMDNTQALDWISKTKNLTIMEAVSKKNLTAETGDLYFGNGLIVDMKERRAHFFDNASKRWIVLRRLIYLTPEGEIEKSIDENTDSDISALIISEEDGYRSVILNDQLADSLFARLYFMRGAGLKHFELAFNEKKEGFTNIYVYKINWSNEAQTYGTK